MFFNYYDYKKISIVYLNVILFFLVKLCQYINIYGLNLYQQYNKILTEYNFYQP